MESSGILVLSDFIMKNILRTIILLIKNGICNCELIEKMVYLRSVNR